MQISEVKKIEIGNGKVFVIKENMAKGKTYVYISASCGYEESKMAGAVPECKEWNTFVEEKVIKSGVSRGKVWQSTKSQVVTFPVYQRQMKNEQKLE